MKNEKNGQNSVATSAVFERGINELMNEDNSLLQEAIKDGVVDDKKGYIQVTIKNNGKLLDYTQKEYKSNQQLNIDYNEFVKYYTKQYMMHTTDDNIKISFGESAVELNFANDFMAYTSRSHKARKMCYCVNGYSVEVYKVEYVEG